MLVFIAWFIVLCMNMDCSVPIMLTWQVSFVCRRHSNSRKFSWSYEETDIRQEKEKEGVAEGVEVGESLSTSPYSRLLS